MRRISFPRRIGRVMRQRRKALGLSQEAFAPQVKMDRVYYSKIERGLIKIRIDTLQRLCLGLKAQPWQVLKDADE